MTANHSTDHHHAVSPILIAACRIDPTVWSRRDVSLVTWTVNDQEEKTYLRDTLQLPFMTDFV